METNENHGVINRPPQPTEARAGYETPITYEVRVPDANWKPYLPYGVSQDNQWMDTHACTHFASGHSVETQIIYLWKTGKLSQEAIIFFTQYLKNPNDINSFRISKQFSSIVGGNTIEGNYFVKAWDTWRNVGLVPDSMLNTMSTAKTFYEYHNPSLITQEMRDIAAQSLKYIKVAYDWLAFDKVPGLSNKDKTTLQTQLKFTPLNPGIPIPATHSVVQHGQKEFTWNQFNTYTPYEREVANDMPSIQYVLRGVVTAKLPEIPFPKPHHTFTASLGYGARGPEVYQLQSVLVYEGLLDKKWVVGKTPTEIQNAYFGIYTFGAVIAFQEKHYKEILTPLGLTNGTGYCGLKTREYLNLHYGN